MLYNMIQSGAISGSRVMNIITKNLGEETAEDVLSLVLN